MEQGAVDHPHAQPPLHYEAHSAVVWQPDGRGGLLEFGATGEIIHTRCIGMFIYLSIYIFIVEHILCLYIYIYIYIYIYVLYIHRICSNVLELLDDNLHRHTTNHI